MNRPRVLVLTHNFVRSEEDLAGQFIYTLLKPLQSQYEFYIVAPHASGLATNEQMGQIKVHRFRYAPIRLEILAYRGDMHELVKKNLSAKILFAFFLIAFFWKTWRLARRNQINLLYAHWWIPGGLIAWLVSYCSGVPYVLTVHGSDISLLGEFSWAKAIARRVLSRARQITTVSTFLAQKIIRLIGSEISKIAIFPMPVDPNKFYRAEQKSPRLFSLLAVGRLVPLKGYDQLIEATKILIEQRLEVRALIIGSGPDEGRLKSLIDKYNLGSIIQIIPNQPHNELNNYYNQADIFIFPSLTEPGGRQEGLGLTILEAMAAGLPVIASQTGGVPDVVRHEENGLLVPEKNPRAIAEAIVRLRADKDLRLHLSQNAQKIVQENFTADRIAARLKRVFEMSIQ